jgi:zinc transport system substrate-binding protein
MMKKLTIFIIFILLFVGCSSQSGVDEKKTIYVTITPLRGIVERVVGDDYQVNVLVPKGASPESFEPTAKQLMELNRAEYIYTTGLINFEKSLIGSVEHNERIIDLSQGIELMEGSCSHGHHHHKHGVDPHIWTSPKALKTMVQNISSSLAPDSVKYQASASKLIGELNGLDMLCSKEIDTHGVDAIMIYHPAFTYYARDYGIEQISIEHDGKEPSPRQLTSLVDRAKTLRIKNLLIQPQYSKDKLRALATECGAEIVEVDPLSEDIMAEIERVTCIICSENEPKRSDN